MLDSNRKVLNSHLGEIGLGESDGEWVTRERAEAHARPSEQGLEGAGDIEDA
jgi:hypothetical protein